MFEIRKFWKIKILSNLNYLLITTIDWPLWLFLLLIKNMINWFNHLHRIYLYLFICICYKRIPHTYQSSSGLVLLDHNSLIKKIKWFLSLYFFFGAAGQIILLISKTFESFISFIMIFYGLYDEGFIISTILFYNINQWILWNNFIL